MFYILFGSDEFGASETVAQLRARLAASDPMAELNYVEIDGRTASVADVRAAADTLPFFGSRRLVVVRGLLARCNRRGGGERRALADEIVAYLPTMADSGRLVLLDGRLDRDHPVREWAVEWLSQQPVPDSAGFVKEFDTPSPGALPGWLAARAAAIGAELERGGATALAEAIVRDKAADLRLAAAELEKLALYAPDRPITSADVELLVAPVSLESVFELVDALAGRDGPTACRVLHHFLAEGEPPLRLLALIARQFRLLALTKWLLGSSVSGRQLPARLGVQPFVANKLTRQAGHFSEAFLHAALRRLRNIDTDIKTGRMDAVLALDLFVAGVCGTPGR
jgi:DNA polymerase-3 subunit delta